MSKLVEKYWQGKSVLITGASSGLGWALTEALSPYAIHFGLLSRNKEKMHQLADSLKNSNSRFFIRSCDIRDREATTQAVNEFQKEAGQIDAAWINGGISRDCSFRNWNWEDIENVIDTNLRGAIYTTQACLELMVPQNKGAIIGIGSAACMRGLPSRGVYSLTKVGLEYYLQSLAPELPQIQFTTIHPGFVDTPINQNNPNRFWILSPQKAARIMLRAVARKRRYVIFPFKMSLLFRLIRGMPLFLYYPIARRIMNVSRPTTK